MDNILAVVGLAGTGKSTIVRALHDLTEAPIVYFGGVVVNEVKRRGLPVTEQNERSVREELRAHNGMAAIALLAAQDIDAALASGRGVIIDGLYSQAEYELLLDRFHGRVRTLAVHTPRSLRELRLGERKDRPLTADEVLSRDLREITTLDKAPPIALADFHVVNDGSMDDLLQQLQRLQLGWVAHSQ